MAADNMVPIGRGGIVTATIQPYVQHPPLAHHPIAYYRGSCLHKGHPPPLHRLAVQSGASWGKGLGDHVTIYTPNQPHNRTDGGPVAQPHTWFPKYWHTGFVPFICADVAIDMNACMRSRAPARTCTRMHARTRARTHAHAHKPYPIPSYPIHAHTHTHTHTQGTHTHTQGTHTHTGNTTLAQTSPGVLGEIKGSDVVS